MATKKTTTPSLVPPLKDKQWDVDLSVHFTVRVFAKDRDNAILAAFREGDLATMEEDIRGYSTLGDSGISVEGVTEVG